MKLTCYKKPSQVRKNYQMLEKLGLPYYQGKED
jgi:hypothetical protein